MYWWPDSHTGWPNKANYMSKILDKFSVSAVNSKPALLSNAATLP